MILKHTIGKKYLIVLSNEAKLFTMSLLLLYPRLKQSSVAAKTLQKSEILETI